MPIEIPIELNSISQSEFDSIDRLVMKCAFAAHNHFGRLCDEKVYENDVAARLREEGVDLLATQVPVTARHQTFTKTYFLDLVVRQMVYELKCESGLSLSHKSQALHYAALLDLNRIKLINFGSNSVQGKLLGTLFAELNRRDVTFNDSQWRSLSPACERLVEIVKDLLLDLGGYLSVSLYREALIELHGGEETCSRRLTVSRDGLAMGTHRALLHDEQCAFVVTAFGRDLSSYTRHVHSLVASLPVSGIQVIDIHHNHVQFITIT